MIGYLIDGRWIVPAAIEYLEYLKLTPQNTWIPCASIKEWTDTPENARAFRIRTSSGADLLFERPKSVQRFDLNLLMVETTPARTIPGTPGQAPVTEAPVADRGAHLAPMPGADKDPNMIGGGRIVLP